MKSFLFSLAITCFFFSCKNQPAGKDAPSSDSTAVPAADSASFRPDTTAGTASFFPVPDFVGGQLRYVDSLQLPLTKSVTINGKTTLVSLPDAEFRRLAECFRKPDISDPAIKKFYKETSLADQSIPSVTLSYTTNNPDLEIRKIDVIIQPDPVKSDKVRTIYMEKSFRANDTIVRQKLYWRVDRNFQIITEKQIGKTFLPAEQLKAVWDPTDEH